MDRVMAIIAWWKPAAEGSTWEQITAAWYTLWARIEQGEARARGSQS